MEYQLFIEKRQKFLICLFGIILALLLIISSFFLFGIYGLLAGIGILFFLILTPLLVNRYKFYVYTWFFGLPIAISLQNYIGGAFAGKNPITAIITGLSLPFAFILFYRDGIKVIRDFPYVIYLIIFDIVAFINLFRPDAYFSWGFGHLKFMTFAIFLILCAYNYVKNNNMREVFNIFTVWTLANSVAAIFQKFTGIGVMVLEGYARAKGFTEHPNELGGTVIVYFILFSYYFKYTDKKELRYLYITTAVFGFLALLLSINKQSILHFMIIMAFIFFNLTNKNKVKISIYTVLLTGLFFALDSFLNLNIFNNVLSRFNDQGSLLWRIDRWKIVLSQFNYNTILIGKGPGVIQNFILSLGTSQTPNFHNGFLELVGAYGLLGLSYTLFYAHLLIFSVKELFKKHEKEVKDLLCVILLFSLITLLRIYGDQALWTRIFIYPMFFFITTVYLRIKNEKNINQN